MKQKMKEEYQQLKREINTLVKEYQDSTLEIIDLDEKEIEEIKELKSKFEFLWKGKCTKMMIISVLLSVLNSLTFVTILSPMIQETFSEVSIHQ